MRGDEQVFLDFEEETGIDIELRGGTAPELYERLQSEGDDTPADVLVTTDLANLWRAEDEGLLQPVTSDVLTENVPEDLHDPDGYYDYRGTNGNKIHYEMAPMAELLGVPPGTLEGADANGLVEGNNFFQVVWLGDERREAYLKTIQGLAKAQNRPPAQQIVFGRHGHVGRQVMVIDRHPRIPVGAGKAEIAFDQRTDPIRPAPFQRGAHVVCP